MRPAIFIFLLVFFGGVAQAHASAKSYIRCKGSTGTYVIQNVTETHITGYIISKHTGDFQILRSHLNGVDCWYVQLENPRDTEMAELIRPLELDRDAATVAN